MKSWTFSISKEANNFLAKQPQKIRARIMDKLSALKKYLENKEPISIDLKSLSGNWLGFYRIRSGKIRIILTIHQEEFLIKIHEIEFRGSIY